MLRCFRPDKLTAGLRHFVIQALGEKFVEPPTFNLGACFAGKFCSASLMPLLPELSFVNSSPTLPWSQLCTSFHLASADSSSTSPLYSPPSSPCLCRLLQHLTSAFRAVNRDGPHGRSTQVRRRSRPIRGQASSHLHGPGARAQGSGAHRGRASHGLLGAAAGDCGEGGWRCGGKVHGRVVRRS